MRGRSGRHLRPVTTILLAGMALVAAPCLGPGSAAAEPLLAALARAYRGNPVLGAERARQRGDDENVPRALSGFRPNISLQAGLGPNYERTKPADGASTNSPLTIGVTIDQNVFDSGRTRASVRSAESAVFGGRATLRGVEQTVLLQAVTAYMDVLRDASVVELRERNIEALTETLRIARKRYETGDTRRTDQAQAESRLARGEADLAAARATLQASVATYRQVIGDEPRGLVFPSPPDGLLPRSLSAGAASARDQHPAIRSAMHAVDAAENDVKVARADLGPSVRLGGSYNYAFGSASSDADPTMPFTGGTQVNVPIYDGGAAYAAVRQAKEVVGQRRAELSAARADVLADLRTAWGALDAARASVPAAQAAVTANEVALQGVQREALEGQRTTLEVLNAQQELLNAQSSLVTARRDVVVASYGVISTLGQLNARRLRLKGPAYRPETHYEQVRDLLAGTRTPDGR